jgi:hypothetical protein
MIAIPSRATETGRTYALVSAIGSTLAYTRLKTQVGSHLEPYDRADLKVPDATLDAAALRGLERIVKQTDPEARFVYLKLNPAEFEGVAAPRRGETAVGKLATALERMPQRSDWHQVLVLTPRYVANERERLGSKLQGIGIYVQPIHSSLMGPALNEIATRDDAEAISPTGERVRASTFIAPYFYAQVWVLDAKTLEVLYTAERFDYQRIHDPKATAIDIENAIPPETLGPMVEKFVEQASAKALREAIGVVTVTEPRIIKSQ